MLVLYKSNMYFAKYNKYGNEYQLNLLYPIHDQDFDIHVNLNTTTINFNEFNGNRQSTLINSNSTDRDILMFIINHGGYHVTKYSSLFKSNNDEAEEEYCEAISLESWIKSIKMENLLTQDLRDVYQDGFLGIKKEYTTKLYIMTYNVGILRHRIGEIETKMRRKDRKRWDRYNRH